MTIDDTWTRLVRYAFVEESLGGRDVLEIGCGDGSGAAFLADRAARVVSTDPSAEVVARARMRTTRPNLEFRTIDPFASAMDDRSFDLICVPSVEAWLRDARFFVEIRRLLRPGGLAYVVAPSADRPGSSSGIGYHDFVALLGRAFPNVRPMAQTPGVHFTLTEFSPDGDIEPSLDGSLLEDPEPCSHYLALCGDGEVPRPGYAMLLVPRAALAEGQTPAHAAEAVRLEARAAQAEAHVELVERELREEKAGARRGAEEPASGDAQSELRAKLQAAEERAAALEAQRQADTWRAQEAAQDATRDVTQETTGQDREIEALREGSRLHEAETQRLQAELGDLRAWTDELDRERAAIEAERATLAGEVERAAARRSDLDLELSRRGMRIAELEGLLKSEAAREQASRAS